MINLTLNIIVMSALQYHNSGWTKRITLPVFFSELLWWHLGLSSHPHFRLYHQQHLESWCFCVDLFTVYQRKVQKLELFPIFVVNALTIAFKICLTLDVLINPFAHIECSIDTVFLSLKLWVNYFVLSLLTNGPFCLIQLSFSYFKLENSSNPTN